MIYSKDHHIYYEFRFRTSFFMPEVILLDSIAVVEVRTLVMTSIV